MVKTITDRNRRANTVRPDTTTEEAPSPEEFYLWDMQTRQLVGVYTNTEEAVRDMGALQSYLGRDQTRHRYDLTRVPDERGMAQPVFPKGEFWGRALVYYDEDIYTYRMSKRL